VQPVRVTRAALQTQVGLEIDSFIGCTLLITYMRVGNCKKRHRE
jgi:hypothetical protein